LDKPFIKIIKIVMIQFFIEVKGLKCIKCATNLKNHDCDNGKTSFAEKYKYSCPGGSKCSKQTRWYSDGRSTEVNRLIVIFSENTKL